jgi:hypothetical protein
MLNIHNLHKIIGNTIPILNPDIKEGTIEDVIQQMGSDGCSYIFKVQVYEPINPNLTGIGMYDIKLDRKRIQYPRELNHCWELSYEEEKNQYIVEAVDRYMVENMGVFELKLGELMDRVLCKSHLVKVVQ